MKALNSQKSVSKLIPKASDNRCYVAFLAQTSFPANRRALHPVLLLRRMAPVEAVHNLAFVSFKLTAVLPATRYRPAILATLSFRSRLGPSL